MPLWRAAVPCRYQLCGADLLFDPTKMPGLSGVDRGRRQSGRVTSYNLRVTYESAEWLRVCYREAKAGVRTMGIVLYVPGTDVLYTRFRDDYPFVQGQDREILGGTSDMIVTLAKDHGPLAAFKWMSEALSTSIFVEGPYPIVTNDPEQTIAALFATNVNESTDETV